MTTTNDSVTMTNERDAAILGEFRKLADVLCPRGDWQWFGPTNAMYDISEERAKEYARLYGGVARKMAE